MNDTNDRQPISDTDLHTAIVIAIKTMMDLERKFTAYTVTQVLRTKYPHIEFAHERVRVRVRDYMFLLPEMRSGEWVKQDGVLFEDAKGPARLYMPAPPITDDDELEGEDEEADETPPVQTLSLGAPSPFEDL